ncbi:sensor histidine kinase [Kitasatospora sp. NPDC004289]
MRERERRGWRHQVREALRAEGRPPAPPSRRARWADVLLAVALTVTALVVAVRYPGDGPIRIGPQQVFTVPAPPDLPLGAVPETAGPDGPSAAALWLLVPLSALPLALRRRWPLAVFALVLAALLALGDRASWINVLCCVLAAYGAVRHSRHRVPAVAALLAGAVVAGVVLRDARPVLPGWSSPAVVLLAAGVSASLVRFWQRRLAAGRERLEELRLAQREETRRAVAEERARIAAELHDVVTHNVSVMVIQAGAARTVLGTAPEQAREALLAVESGGRAALAELRQVMGLLAAPEHERAEGLEPQPGLGQLDALVERVVAAGLPVETSVALPAEPLAPIVELTVYRVVQEALTNTLKHAPGARARITLETSGEWLAIEATDTGPAGARVPVSTGGGRGLIGLRERLAVCGGELTAGPTLAGGYRITARLPWRTG